MANQLNLATSFNTGDTVSAASLNNLINTTTVNAAIIKNQIEITTIGTADLLLIAPDSVDASLAPRKVTVQNLLDDGLTAGTFSSLNLTGALTYGTATGNRTVSTSATITTGTIPNLTSSTASITLGTIPTLTAGTTTSTAANITNGTIQTLTASTATISQGSAILTQGTVATLNSTTATITNLSTTLAGDLTISQGTATLATTGATAGTYGSASAIPFITIDAKGRITSATTGTFSSTPADGSITYAKLSTSATESDNVASRTAKAWVNFDGTTNTGGNCTIRSDFNVSTVADNGTGYYTVNFSTAMANANYATIGLAQYQNNVGQTILEGPNDPSTSSVSVRTKTNANAATDSVYVSVAIFSS